MASQLFSVSSAAVTSLRSLRRSSPRPPRSTRASPTRAMASTPPTPAFTLCYFDVMALGLPCGMVAAHSNLQWKGKDRETWDWPTVKAEGKAPFNQLPLLFRTGKRTVAHSTSIVNIIAKMATESNTVANYDGTSNDDDFVVSNMITNEASDIYAALQKGQPTVYVPHGSGGKTDALHAELWGSEGRISLKNHFNCLERLVVDGDKFTSSKTAGEMFLWGMLHQVVLIDQAPFENTPKLKGFYDRVLELPETKAMIDGSSPMGAMTQYFVAGPEQEGK